MRREGAMFPFQEYLDSFRLAIKKKIGPILVFDRI